MIAHLEKSVAMLQCLIAQASHCKIAPEITNPRKLKGTVLTAEFRITLQITAHLDIPEFTEQPPPLPEVYQLMGPRLISVFALRQLIGLFPEFHR